MRYQIAALLGVFIQLSLRSSDAKPTQNKTVRLIGGSSNLEGRVEVYHDEHWGTICSDKFDDDDAKVLCHMLGFDRVGARAYTNANFGGGAGKIWLDNLGCKGTEESVGNCQRNVWGHHNCDHHADAGIKCLPKINDFEFEGNVSVMLNCTALSTPTNGRFSPETCQSEAVISGSVCRLVCEPGYKANMSFDSYNCLVTGKWDSNVLSACIDVDECLTKNGGCQYTCMNTEGSYTCSCESGYRLKHDLHTCTDVDECLTENGGCQLTCMNTEGSYTCTCESGYRLKRDHETCRDIDECFTDNGGCQHTCMNTEGSYTCSCESGYQLNEDHHTCTDVDKCLNGGCQHTCINFEGFFTCSYVNKFTPGTNILWPAVVGSIGGMLGIALIVVAVVLVSKRFKKKEIEETENPADEVASGQEYLTLHPEVTGEEHTYQQLSAETRQPEMQKAYENLKLKCLGSEQRSDSEGTNTDL